MMPRSFCALAAALVAVGAAGADTAYLKPSDFAPRAAETVTLEAAFSDFCCEPRYAVQSEVFRVITPDGQQQPPDRIETFATMTVLEHTVTQEGTTRFTTGERLGRKGEYVFLDGRYHLVNSPDAELVHVPEGTPVLTSQTATVSDVYLTAGAAGWEAARVEVGRLAIQPVDHPGLVLTGAPFAARVMLDGMPAPGLAVLVTSEAQRLHGAAGFTVQTGKDGRFSLVFDKPGVALLMVRLQAPAPVGATTDIRSYTTSLTLEVRGH